MTTFTSSLPSDLLHNLAEMAKKHNIAKNKIIEKALTIYLDQFKPGQNMCVPIKKRARMWQPCRSPKRVWPTIWKI